MHFSGGLWICPAKNLLNSVEVYIHTFHLVSWWQFFSSWFSFSSWDSHKVHTLVCLVVYQRAFRFCSLFFNLYSLYTSFSYFNCPSYHQVLWYFWLFKSAYKYIYWHFYFTYCNFHLQNFFPVPFYVLFYFKKILLTWYLLLKIKKKWKYLTNVNPSDISDI